MNTDNKKLLEGLAAKEAIGINKGFELDVATGLIITKNTLEMWIKSFSEDEKLKANKKKIEALEVFSKSLLCSIKNEFKEHVKTVLSSPEITADELFKSHESNSILMKMIQDKVFIKPPLWTKHFNKNILD